MKLDSNLAGGLKLKTSLQKGAVFPVILAIMVTLGLFLRSRYTSEARDKLIVAQEAIVVVMDFNMATSSLIGGDPAMNLKLWEVKYNSLKSFLNLNKSTGMLAPYAVLDMNNKQGRVRSGLQALVTKGFINAREPLAEDRFEVEGYRETAGEITVAMLSMMSTASGEASKSRSSLKMAEHMANNILMVFVAVFSMLMAGATIAYSQNAVSRLRRLKEVSVAAATGDYSRRVENLGANDEIGQTLRAFNAMVAKFNEVFGQVSGELQDVKQNSTNSKKVASAARESNMRLADALTRLKRAQGQIIQQERVQVLQQVANGMARDFNDALEPILSSSDYLLSYPEQREDGKELVENLKLINSAAVLAHTQVRRLAAVFKTPDHTAVKCVDLKAVIEKSLRVIDKKRLELEKEKGIKISCVTNLLDVPTVQAEEGDLEDAVMGIMMNAFESMTADGKVVVVMKSYDDMVVLEIKDNGCGMNEEMSRRSMEPFFSTKGDDHSGMGLTTAMTAAGHYGGTLDVASEEGKGTTIMVKLPVCTEEHKVAVGVESDTESKLNILLVDDEEWILKIIKKCLASEGHNVETALTGKEGLDKLKNGDFDLAVLDWALPDMNGGQLANIIKASSPDIRMIILSGFGDVVKNEGLVPEGVNVVLSKPVTIDDLRIAVMQAMS